MFEPVKVTDENAAIEEARMPAFITTTDGKETTYTIPEKINGGTALLALEVYVSRGEEACVLWLARHALGPDGMDAVLNSPHLSVLDARTLLDRIGMHYVGQVKQLGKEQDGDSGK